MNNSKFFVDINKCVQCNTCALICKKTHKYSDTMRRKLISFENESRQVIFSISCQHCLSPACMMVCRNSCIKKLKTGAVIIDNKNCIGCGNCAAACPFNAITLSKLTKKADKCDFCQDRTKHNQKPACVEGCPTNAIDITPATEIENYKLLDEMFKIKKFIKPSTLYKIDDKEHRSSFVLEEDYE